MKCFPNDNFGEFYNKRYFQIFNNTKLWMPFIEQARSDKHNVGAQLLQYFEY